MSRKRTKPLDIPTIMLAVGPLLVLTVLTAGWVRKGMTRKTLLEAARRGDVPRLKQLLDSGADVNEMDGIGWTALGYAANQRHYEAANLLLGRGAEVNTRGHAGTALAMACSPIWFDGGQTGSSAQANGAHARIIRLLLDHGADPRLDNRDWDSPLSRLIVSGDTASAKLLIEHGANVNGRENGGYPVLYAAVMSNSVELTRLLLAKGARPNEPDPSSGETPLIHAVEARKHSEVQVLLKFGARTDLRDKLGQTALQYAIKVKDPQIMALLKASGAKQ